MSRYCPLKAAPPRQLHPVIIHRELAILLGSYSKFSAHQNQRAAGQRSRRVLSGQEGIVPLKPESFYPPHTQQLPGSSRQLSKKTILQNFALMQNSVLIFRSNKLAQINSKASLYFTTRTRHTLSMAASFSAIASSTGASVSTRVYANSPRALLVRFAMLIPASPKRLVIWAIILGTLR